MSDSLGFVEDLPFEKIPAEIARLHQFLGHIEQQHLDNRAEYRHWRATIGQEILAGDPKLAEWKVSQQIEADERFVELKSKEAFLRERAETVRGLIAAYTMQHAAQHASVWAQTQSVKQ